MKTEISFVMAEMNDIDDLIDVQNIAFKNDYIKYGYCPGYGHTMTSMKNLVEKCIVYKIMMDERIVGDIIVRHKENGDYFLGGLCVIPEFENKGIGQMAVKFIEKQLDASYWSLETPAENKRNIYFYQKCGFQITKEYMDGPVRIVLMEKYMNGR